VAKTAHKVVVAMGLVAVGLAGTPPAAFGAEPDFPAMRILVITVAGVPPPEMLVQPQAETARIYAAAGVTLVWETRGDPIRAVHPADPLSLAHLGAGQPVGAAGADAPVMPRVRSSNISIAALISQASEQSKTFRSVVDTINDSDGIVYVEEGECGHGVPACLVTVLQAGANRILRVNVDTRKADCELMGLIGHELQHTIEVLSERNVNSGVAMSMFFSRVGRRGTMDTFETSAAVRAGTAVSDEVRRYRARAKGR